MPRTQILLRYRGDQGIQAWEIMGLDAFLAWEASLPDGPFLADCPGGPAYFQDAEEFLGRVEAVRLTAGKERFVRDVFGASYGRFPSDFQEETFRGDQVVCPGCSDEVWHGEVRRGLCRGCREDCERPLAA